MHVSNLFAFSIDKQTYYEIISKQIRMQFNDSDFPTMLTFGNVLHMQI